MTPQKLQQLKQLFKSIYDSHFIFHRRCTKLFNYLNNEFPDEFKNDVVKRALDESKANKTS